MAVELDDQREMLERLEALRTLIARYRGHLEEGDSRPTAAAYLHAIQIAEAEIAETERYINAPAPFR